MTRGLVTWLASGRNNCVLPVTSVISAKSVSKHFVVIVKSASLAASDVSSATSTQCMCAPSDFCVAYDGEAPIIEIRKYLRGEPQTEEEAEFVEAMGFTVGFFCNFWRL